MKNFTKEEIEYNRKIKKSIFEVLLEEANTFYIHCIDHPQLVIGDRGLIGKEKEEGIVLVLGPYSYRNLHWDEKGISCEMNFAKWEYVYIPYESIFRFFDKAGQCLFQFLVIQNNEQELEKKEEALQKDQNEQEKVIKIDFTKKNKRE